jgi:hypothetical protein
MKQATLLCLPFDPEDVGYILLKRWLAFNVLYGVMSQKIELFIATTVRTSVPTKAN